MSQLAINRYIDAAILKPETTRQESRRAIESMIACKARTVCVRPCDIALATSLCRGTDTDVSCVLAFPHGVALSESKADEARRYVSLGVSEIDMVVNYGFVLSGEWELVEKDIRAVSDVAAVKGVLLKVILETCQLSQQEIARATEVAIKAKADFVKTSTGFSDSGASEEAVKTMIRAAKGRIQVKASGGIRDLQRAKLFIGLGCTRLGVNYTTTATLCGAQQGGPVEGSSAEEARGY
jgi:deoxyribose-phosphate aldolase